jgi:hypothetical protein
LNANIRARLVGKIGNRPQQLCVATPDRPERAGVRSA